jgi:hypothetical protein
MKRTDLGSHLAAHKESLHHRRRACDRSHRDVQRGEIRVVVRGTGLSQQGATR